MEIGDNAGRLNSRLVILPLVERPAGTHQGSGIGDRGSGIGDRGSGCFFPWSQVPSPKSPIPDPQSLFPHPKSPIPDPRSLFLLLILCLVAQNLSAQGLSLSLDDALKNLESRELGAAELYWDPFFSSGYFVSGDHRVSFYTGNAGETGPVLFDNRETINLPLPYAEGGSLRFPDAFVQRLKSSFTYYEEEDKTKYRVAAIVIDPGHGGKDPGAIATHTINGRSVTLQEKDINLKVSRLLHSRLRAAYPNKRILLTREGDTFPSLDDRAILANSNSAEMEDNEAIIFVSVHTNSSLSKNAKGYEIFYLYPDYHRDLIDRSRYADSSELIPILNDMMEEEVTTQSIRLANSIMNSFERTIGNAMQSRGVKEKDYYVVRNARMPSVLVELGFLTNESDARLLGDDSYLRNFSEALYKGISDFIALFEQ